MHGADNTNLIVMGDGLRIVTRHIPNAVVTKVRTRIGAGSRDEVFGEFPRGTSHKVEHDVFKGSQKYPRAGQASDTIERLGGSVNAASDFDMTVYDITVPSKKLPTGLRVLGSIVSTPSFPADEVQAETATVLNEWVKGQNNLSTIQFTRTIAASSGHAPLLAPVIGDLTSIPAITREDEVRFHANGYRAGNTVIAIEGNLQGQDIRALVQENFRLRPGAREATAPPPYVGGDIRQDASSLIPGTNVRLAFPIPAYTDAEAIAPYRVLGKLLGGTTKASLFEEMRSRERGVYGVAVERTIFVDYSLLTISFDSFGHNVRKNLKAVATQLHRLSEGVDADSLRIVRSKARFNNKNRMRDLTHGVTELSDEVAIFGRVLPRDFVHKLEMAVTVPQIQKAAQSLLESRPTFVALGVLDGVPKPEEIPQILRPAARTSGNTVLQVQARPDNSQFAQAALK